MEHDQAFEADAEVDVFERARLRSHSQRRFSDEGRNTMRVTLGGFESQKPSEHTPLLPAETHRDVETDDRLGEDEDAGQKSRQWDGLNDFEGRPWWRTPSIFWLLPPYALFAMAFGGVVVPRLNLILDLICQKYFSERSALDPTFHMAPVMLGTENPQCHASPEVQSLVSKFTLYQGLISGILSAIVSPKLGALSDRYGRIRVICLSTIGMLLNEVITILVAVYTDTFSVYWILLGAVFDGLGGTFIAAMAVSFAYASDCTIPHKRNVAFGYYHGSLFGGIAAGPILAGYIVKKTGDILSVFYIAFALHCSFLFFNLLIVPESLSKRRQMAARQKPEDVGEGEHLSRNSESYLLSFFRGVNVFAPLTILWPTGKGTKSTVRRNLVLLAATDTVMFGVAMGGMTVVLLYTGYMFGWDTFQTSGFVSIVNTSRVITLIVILPTISRILRGPSVKSVQRTSGSDLIDLNIIRIAIFFDLFGYIGYTLVRTGPLFTLCGAVAALGGMGSPTIQAALTKHVSPDHTGQVLGAMGLLHALAKVIAPIIFNLIYAGTVGKFTQTVFVCLAVTFGIAFGMSWFIKPYVYWDEPSPKATGSESGDAHGGRAAQEEQDGEDSVAR